MHTKCKIIHTDIKPENVLIVMDNAASLNQQIDEAITTLKDRGYGGHWFPDSYGKLNFITLTMKKSRPPTNQNLFYVFLIHFHNRQQNYMKF